MDQKLLLFNPFLHEQEESQQPGVTPENMSQSTFLAVKADNNKMALPSSSPKRRSRRVVQKRVISVPIGDLDCSRQKGEGAPPSDSWAWRKYGQKPIKGSPYPRGYYRCSSSKGCPARKQVERSRSDPSMLLVTYACEHNHPWPVSRNSNATAGTTKFPPVFASSQEIENEEKPEPEDGLLGSDEFCWFPDPDVNSSPAMDGFLENPICAGNSDEHVALTEEKYCEDESFFADLGELPECSVVFRRGFMEMQVEENRRSLRAASWCGSTG